LSWYNFKNYTKRDEMAVPEDIGCENKACIKAPECNRQKIREEGIAREVKSFGGTPEKGCGKFLPIPKDEQRV
jgi:hypothetical protein